METPPLRHFLFVVCFFAFFAILVSTMPIELISSADDFREVSHPTLFESSSIEDLASSYLINVTYSPIPPHIFVDYWGIAEGFGHNFVCEVKEEAGGEPSVENRHYYPFLGIPTGSHQMHWISKESGIDYGGQVTSQEYEKEETYQEGSNVSAYVVKCDHVTMHGWIGYNNTDYSNITDAWENDELKVEFAIEWDELGTGLNAWNLISAILFYQTPDIHWTINSFIAIPLWVSIAWMVFAFILAVVNALPFT